MSAKLRLYLYWYQRLQHPSHITIVRLSERNILPSAIKYAKRVPTGAACLLIKSQRRAWRTKGKDKLSSRMAHHNKPGKGTLLITSYHINLVSYHSHFQMIKSTSIQKSLDAKDAYKKVLQEYGHKVEAYQAGNSSWIPPPEWHCRSNEQETNPCHKNKSEGGDCSRGFSHLGLPSVYVLDGRLQSGSGIGPHKWDPRSRAGVYLGHSPVYAENAALVLNPHTGHVSQQYHVVFDDEFTTVPYLQSAEEPPNWKYLVKHHTKHATEEAFNIASLWYEREKEPIPVENNTATSATLDAPDHVREPTPVIDLSTAGLRRSPRVRELNLRTAEVDFKTSIGTGFLLNAKLKITRLKKGLNICYQTPTVNYEEFIDTTFDGTHNQLSITGQIFSAELSNECYNLSEMMKQMDKKDFKDAKYKEVKHMFDNKVWEKVARDEMIAYYRDLKKQGIIVKRKQLILIWMLKSKSHTDGSLSNHKAILCCHGGRQNGE
eukprot:15366023-Ditylum_brightwellii.AAC.3